MKKAFILFLALLAMCVVTSGAAAAATCYSASVFGYENPESVDYWYLIAYDNGDFVDNLQGAGFWDTYGSLMYFQYTNTTFPLFLSGTKKAGFWSEDGYVGYYTLKKLSKKQASTYCNF